MIALLCTIFATLLHAALMLALAPLLAGLIATARARLLGRRGPPLLQPYWNLNRLRRKTTFMPDNATDLYAAWPLLCFAAIAAAAALTPGFCTGLATASSSDFVTLIGLLALGRAAILLAGLETGAGFAGAGAAREVMFSLFAEAALLVVLLTFVLIAHQPTIDGIAIAFRTGPISLSVSLAFALAAMLAVAVTETGRNPTDNPAGHLELAMVHEAMLLDYSGRYLLLFEAAAMLRLMVWMSLIGTIFAPFFMASAANPLTWPVGLVFWLAKLGLCACLLAAFEISTAKMRVFRVPEFIGGALLLGMLSSVFLFVAGRLGG